MTRAIDAVAIGAAACRASELLTRRARPAIITIALVEGATHAVAAAILGAYALRAIDATPA